MDEEQNGLSTFLVWSNAMGKWLPSRELWGSISCDRYVALFTKIHVFYESRINKNSETKRAPRQFPFLSPIRAESLAWLETTGDLFTHKQILGQEIKRKLWGFRVFRTQTGQIRSTKDITQSGTCTMNNSETQHGSHISFPEVLETPRCRKQNSELQMKVQDASDLHIKTKQSLGCPGSKHLIHVTPLLLAYLVVNRNPCGCLLMPRPELEDGFQKIRRYTLFLNDIVLFFVITVVV